MKKYLIIMCSIFLLAGCNDSNKNDELSKLAELNEEETISKTNNPNETRNRIINDYRLIKGNNKYLEDQLRMLKINVEEFNKKYGN